MPAAATVLLCLYFPVPFIMLWLHMSVWKRWGGASYVIHVPLYLTMVAAIALTHPWISWRAWYLAAPLRITGAAVVASAVVVLAASYRAIDSWTAMAGPQISGARRELIDTGIYARVRHPRYTALLLGAAGNALLTGYPLVCAAAAVTVAMVAVMTRVEEQELTHHFGDEYRHYAARVPRFFPRPK